MRAVATHVVASHSHFFSHCVGCLLHLVLNFLHRVPKLATPLDSNTLNSVWSTWISTKYRTLHYLNITYYREQVYKVKVNDVDELRQRIQRPDCMGWPWPAYYDIDKAVKQWRTRLRAYVEAKGGHFEHKLWRLVQIQNDRLHECFTFCKNLSGIKTINAFTPTYL